VYTYARAPGRPPVSALRWADTAADPGVGHAHAHDFLVLVFFERGGGGVRLGRREVPIEHGDVLVVAPGAVIGRATEPLDAGAVGWAVWFPADVLDAPGAALAWRSHPLLSAFAGGARRLRVPEADRAAWSARCTALVDELEGRREGHHEAVLAHLTLLLVALSRLASAAPGGMRLRDEPLLGAVFAEIEARFAGPLSLAGVAAAVGLTPGHLTTVVRRRTGRTVQGWIDERRMAEARRLLAETDLTAAAIGAAVGIPDPSYFVRRFRVAHGITPLAWRRELRR
jgi:AraC-like DNA-binding protein